MRKNKFTIAVLVITLCWVSLAVSQDDLSKWRAQLAEKSQQISKIEKDIARAQEQYQQTVANCETAEKNVKNAENENNRTKDAYDRATQNIDLVSPDSLANLATAYQTANQRHRSAQAQAQQLDNEKRKLNQEIERLKKDKTEKETEELEIKAAMFDEEMSKPVWSEGYGESILDEDKSMKECRELALSYARRDATEKGGKMILRSITEIEEFKLVKDEITTEANVQIIDQDNSGNYGKAIRVDQGDVIKFIAIVRLKLQSTGIHNPFRDRLDDSGQKTDAGREGTPQAIKSLSVRENRSHTWLYIGGAAVLVAGGTAAYFLLKEKETQGTLSVRVPVHP